MYQCDKFKIILVNKCLPSVTLEIKMPSSSPLKGVDPIPPAIDKPNPPVVLSI